MDNGDIGQAMALSCAMNKLDDNEQTIKEIEKRIEAIEKTLSVLDILTKKFKQHP